MNPSQDVPETSPENPARLLWMTDTFGDHNGVSTVLKSILQEIRTRNYPVDLMVCSNTIEPADHLLVVKAVSEFSLPFYRQQPFRVPNYLSVLRTFRKGRYTAVMCSTEGPMGMAGLWLKRSCSVKAYFYLHTDWLVFAKEVLRFEETGMKNLQRALRFYYSRFDAGFVLNRDQREWLTGRGMGLPPERVHLTAHWADPVFSNLLKRNRRKFPFNTRKPVVLYAGRLSREKGVLELPYLYDAIRSRLPEAQMIVAGRGPAEEELKQGLPDAWYLGWVDQQDLPSLYLSADILVLPSRFDTFSCVVLEALSCGLPVAAYNTKGPKDILQDRLNGYLVETREEMAERVIAYLQDPEIKFTMKQAAFIRAEDYRSDHIMDRLLSDLGIMKTAHA